MSVSMTARRTLCFFLWLGLSASGCGSAEPAAGHLTEAQLPSRDEFPVVAHAMQLRCGTLDCHGQVGRNLRLYGVGGLRLSTPESPIVDSVFDPTTVPELDASYQSTIGLEPEALWRVRDQRASPTQLSLVRKIRGIEKHKGGQLAHEGDALDRCLVLWLTADADPDSCEQVIAAPRPEVD
jgi:hypothetical protein